jgi:outer membrane lipoprotein SlyB
MKPATIYCLIALALLPACGDEPSQNRYASRDVGMNTTVLFGTILSERQVQVTGEDSGAGALAGGAGGGVAGSLIGAGRGSVLGTLGGAIAGMFVGNEAEKSMGNRAGIEYIIALDNGANQSIVQNIAKDDAPLPAGSRVMVQTQGSYRRVLPATMVSPAAPVSSASVPAGR